MVDLRRHFGALRHIYKKETPRCQSGQSTTRNPTLVRPDTYRSMSKTGAPPKARASVDERGAIGVDREGDNDPLQSSWG